MSDLAKRRISMKLTSLLRRHMPLDQSAMTCAALCSAVLLFAAHAFCFFNLTYSSGSVMLHVASGRSAQIAAGAYLQPIYWRIRGGISSPLFVGMLSMLYLTANNLITVFLLRISQKPALFALCAAASVNAAVLSICAGSLHTADAAFLALLLCAIACALCMRVRFGVIPGALMLTCAFALDSSCCAYFASLMLITAVSDLLVSGDVKGFLADAARLFGMMIAAIAVYLLGYALMLRRSGLDEQMPLLLFGGDLIQAYLSPFRALLAPLTAYPLLNTVLRALFVLVCLCALVHCARTKGKTVTLLLAVSLLLFPLLGGLTLFAGQESLQITAAHCLSDVLVIMLACRLWGSRIRLQRALGAAFAVLALGGIVFSNQVYLKKNLEFESTLSVMSRVIARAEAVEGYQPGSTPVAIIGTPEHSILSVQRKGFEHLSALDAANANYAIANDTDMIWYIWEVMGYPFNFVSTYELEQIKKSEAAQAMPAFPQDGCCQFIGETLVIRL